MAYVSNLSIDQGATYSVSIIVNNEDGSVRDLTTYSGRSQMRRSYSTTANVAFSIYINNPANGEIIMSLTAAQTANIKPGRYVYDLELVNSSNVSVERIVEGIITVYPEVTR